MKQGHARGNKPAEDARGRILAAARKAFATTGFEGASTRAIAAEAGVAQSLLLYHFHCKETLWRAVMDGLFARLAASMTADPAALRGASPGERLMVLVRTFIAFCAEDADLHRIITFEGRSPTPRLRWLVDTHLKRAHDTTRSLIELGQASGEVRPGDPTLLYYSFIAIAGTAYSLAPEIGLVSDGAANVDPKAVEDIIRSTLLVPRL